ncbi:NADH-cytochrome b5 reductase-like isoform X9 [Gallus gallus]|uniref:NADH-cytochrome b5 reductase-like isoform X9 n=1 Tax=Gallus gallus TaxID=9031 RepID=UPI001F01B0F9|nr:NADH-cytochrome b5 reductase-like isoform X9 [Gallus gallus]
MGELRGEGGRSINAAAVRRAVPCWDGGGWRGRVEPPSEGGWGPSGRGGVLRAERLRAAGHERERGGVAGSQAPGALSIAVLRRRLPASGNSELSPDAFTAFSLSWVRQLTEDTYQCRFELPGNGSLRLGLGQHLVLRAFHPKGSYSYSPAVTKECYEAGLMSQYIKTWKEGDTAFWRGPFGGFPYRPNKHGELLMLASGTGLAPMLPILQSITDDEEDETFVTLVGCFCTFEKIYLKPLLQDLAQYWNIRIFYVLSQETSKENLPWSYQENTYIGRLNEDLIRTVINSCRRKPFVLICGSSAFTEDMNRYLKAAGIEEDSCFVF